MSFEYKVEIPTDDGGTEHAVLRFKSLRLKPNGIARLNRNSNIDYMFASIEWGLSDEDLEVFDRTTEEDLPKIYRAWQEAEGIEEGESDASSTSSTSTVRHSKQTSSETGSD